MQSNSTSDSLDSTLIKDNSQTNNALKKNDLFVSLRLANFIISRVAIFFVMTDSVLHRSTSVERYDRSMNKTS